MPSRSVLASAVFLACAAALPAPHKSGTVAATGTGDSLPGYSDASAPFGQSTPSPYTISETTFGMDSQISAIHTTFIKAGKPGGADTLRTVDPTGATYHGPYSGTPTVTGAVSNSPTAKTIPALPLNPEETYYNKDGALQSKQPAPYVPAGGLGTNGTQPRYMVESDFDYESIMLGLYQEWIELDCFNNGLAIFSVEDFEAYGMTAEDYSLIQFMAQQEAGHATLLSNMLGETAAPQCTYNYPYTNPREFVDFNQILTRFGESGVWGRSC